MPEPFVHLHCHNDDSMLDGACEIGEQMKMTFEMGMPAVAMTDHGNLFGAVEFYSKAKETGVHPVIGCEIYITQQSHTVKNESNRHNHLVVLCESQEGYRNITKLVSTAYMDGFYKPRIDKGLIATSSCRRGDINEALATNRYEDQHTALGSLATCQHVLLSRCRSSRLCSIRKAWCQRTIQ